MSSLKCLGSSFKILKEETDKGARRDFFRNFSKQLQKTLLNIMQGMIPAQFSVHMTGSHLFFPCSVWLTGNEIRQATCVQLFCSQCSSCSFYHQKSTDDLMETWDFYPIHNKEKEHETYLILYIEVYILNSGKLHFLSLWLPRQWALLRFWY